MIVSDQQARMLRTKMVGALIRKTRQDSGQSIEEIAQAMDLNASVLQEYESGQRGIPLPDLELLCYHFDVDIDDVLANKPPGPKAKEEIKPDVLRSLRQRIIAAQLRKLRQDKVAEVDAVAEAIGLTPETLEAYERGNQPIPVPELEALSAYYDAPFEQFFAHEGPLARKSVETPPPDALDLPQDLIEFVGQTSNIPYLRLARALRQMPDEELRQFAQSLIDEEA
jgi:transcriptional regulator with XRE-family HTH domain